MGRGRAKAKQQKVARDLKYSSQHTDFGALQRELTGGANGSYATSEFDEDDEESDEFDDEDEDEDDGWQPSAPR